MSLVNDTFVTSFNTIFANQIKDKYLNYFLLVQRKYPKCFCDGVFSVYYILLSNCNDLYSVQIKQKTIYNILPTTSLTNIKRSIKILQVFGFISKNYGLTDKFQTTVYNIHDKEIIDLVIKERSEVLSKSNQNDICAGSFPVFYGDEAIKIIRDKYPQVNV